MVWSPAAARTPRDTGNTTEPGTTETNDTVNTGDTAEGGETTGDATAITIWTYPIGKFGDRDAVNELIAKFNEVHPEISVTLELLDYTNGDTQGHRRHHRRHHA